MSFFPFINLYKIMFIAQVLRTEYRHIIFYIFFNHPMHLNGHNSSTCSIMTLNRILFEYN